MYIMTVVLPDFCFFYWDNGGLPKYYMEDYSCVLLIMTQQRLGCGTVVSHISLRCRNLCVFPLSYILQVDRNSKYL
jgi:hypothetical protein